MTEIERVGMGTDEFEAAESVIEHGRETFIEVGQALMAIRDGRGYRLAGHTTFESYCQKRWGWTRHAGYDYIRAAEVAANVELTQQSQPSLTQARTLAVLPPEQQREVAASVDFEHATVREVREEVRRIQAPTARVQPVVEDGERRFEQVPVAIDLARNGFDPATLPPMRLSHAQNAFYAIPKLASYLDVEPCEVADAAERDNRLDADVQFFGAIDAWLQAVIREIDSRRNRRLTLVQGGSR